MKKKIIGLVVIGIFLLMLGNTSFAGAYSNELPKDNDEYIISEGNELEVMMAPSWYSKPDSYAELVGWYQSLESSYPDYIDVFKANELYETGTATGGYDLYYVRITNESLGLHKPEVLFLGNPHGDEVVGCVGLYWFTDWLMRMAFTEETHEEFSKDYLQWIIDNREIYIEVIHNPYGYDNGPQRYDGNGWDLNREADYDGPGTPTGGIWASVNGQTLVEFIEHHLCRIGCDFHAGVRMLLYPWAMTYPGVSGTSPISGRSYSHAPPDFYFYDASQLRVGDFMGDYGGDLNYANIGPISDLLTYTIKGGIAPWAYAADIEKNPAEDPYVNGNYPGAGLLWASPEMSTIKNVPESDFGNDTIHRYGAEVRRFVLHQTDLAQPYLRWYPGTIENDGEVPPGTTIPLKWQVNGSMVVDHTYIQWGTDPDPVNNPEFYTPDHDEYAGEYIGGTGWDGAESGETNGVIHNGNLYLTKPGDYYFVAKAQVDQVYADVLSPDVYGDNPYLRLIKERTNDSYYEMLEGTDGTEEIFGQTWWYSSIIHVTVLNDPPDKPDKPSGPSSGNPGEEYTYTTKTTDPDGDEVYYKWDWGDETSDWEGPFNSGETVESKHIWAEGGTYQIKVKAKDEHDDESDWSEPLSVTMPRNRIVNKPFLQFLQQHPNLFPILQQLLGLL
ncbi:MAG: PKD domain-containing protein [Thermoplasmatales archaeon]|nr:PKD domain-containing protein [Thermoplasmatales archaeon]